MTSHYDDEYFATFHDLIQGLAQKALTEHAELVDHGFCLVEVVGSPALLYRRGDKFYTREAALDAVWIIPEQKEDRS